MENEINLEVKNLGLNLFPGESHPSEKLMDLLERNLVVIAGRTQSLLGKSFKRIEINLNIVSDEEIRQINQEYRQKDKATDVLSFPLQENVRRGDFDDFDGHLELGDIFIATGVCAQQANEHNLNFEEEFAHLFTHGFLHLCGYDHEENEVEDKLMRGLESEIMDELAGK